MPGPTTPITDREKAAILAYNLGILPDAKTAYFVAEDKAVKDIPQKALKSMISKWINSPKFTQFDDYVNRLLADRDSDARRRGRQEAEKRMQQGDARNEEEAGRSDHAETQPGKTVDYYDPANQRKQINRIIQEASDDPKTQLDAIKAIQQTQRDDRQAARDQKQVKSYLPLRCLSCPLYTKARKNTTK